MMTVSESQTPQAPISIDECARYVDDGYIVPRHRLVPRKLRRIRRSYRRHIDAHPRMDLDFIPSPHIPGFVPGLNECQDWLDYAAIPEVLDAIEALIGADFLMWGSAIFGKPGLTGKATPMHQDGEYWPIKPLASVTVWIALDDTGPDNGCLRVVPGSHRTKRLYNHRHDDDPQLTLNQATDYSAVNLESAVDNCLEAGQFSIHDVHLLHGYAPRRRLIGVPV